MPCSAECSLSTPWEKGSAEQGMASGRIAPVLDRSCGADRREDSAGTVSVNGVVAFSHYEHFTHCSHQFFYFTFEADNFGSASIKTIFSAFSNFNSPKIFATLLYSFASKYKITLIEFFVLFACS